ncbi:hypothetical protein FGO68_gene10041 [Halteria grandinella]|uniref:Cyclic nucleotide-binding domain-containing protein n=1 Tax=Halteria grandinella TaxID=5974 RepID=A0A8J8P789_HALGN|nr:hypothetical protein FGO68_gene10041 [Halteria grandinella]
MVPATSHQAIVVSILVILSEFIHAHILGTIEVVLLALNRKSSKFSEQIEFATSTMKNMKIPRELQNKIVLYMIMKQNDLDAQKELDNLMSMISPNLKTQITQHLFLNALQSISYFSNQVDLIDFILNEIDALQFMPEDFIIKQGQKATHMYILASGECDVLVKDQNKKETIISTIGPGTLFGEVALLFGTKRTCSIKSREQCSVGALSEEFFASLVQIYPDIEKNLRENTKKYKDHWKLFQINTLEQVPYFKGLSFAKREEIHYKLQQENFEKGAQIIQKDQECTDVIFVVSGQMDLIIEKEGKEYFLDSLGPGCTLGAYSIFNETPFVFGAKARTNVSLLLLSRDDLLDMADQFDELALLIEVRTEFLLNYDVPQCDYTHPFDFLRGIDGYSKLDHRELLKRSIRKTIVLNQAREQKKIKMVEIINALKEMKKRQSLGMDTKELLLGLKQPGQTLFQFGGPGGGPFSSNFAPTHGKQAGNAYVGFRQQDSMVKDAKGGRGQPLFGVQKKATLFGQAGNRDEDQGNGQSRRMFSLRRLNTNDQGEATPFHQDINLLKTNLGIVQKDVKRVIEMLSMLCGSQIEVGKLSPDSSSLREISPSLHNSRGQEQNISPQDISLIINQQNLLPLSRKNTEKKSGSNSQRNTTDDKNAESKLNQPSYRMQMTNIEEENSDSLKSSMIESDDSHHRSKQKVPQKHNTVVSRENSILDQSIEEKSDKRRLILNNKESLDILKVEIDQNDTQDQLSSGDVTVKVAQDFILEQITPQVQPLEMSLMNHSQSTHNFSEGISPIPDSGSNLISGQAPSDRIPHVIQKFFNNKITYMKSTYKKPDPLIQDALYENTSASYSEPQKALSSNKASKATPKFTEFAKPYQVPMPIEQSIQISSEYPKGAIMAPGSEGGQNGKRITQDIMQLVMNIKAIKDAKQNTRMSGGIQMTQKDQIQNQLMQPIQIDVPNRMSAPYENQQRTGTGIDNLINAGQVNNIMMDFKNQIENEDKVRKSRNDDVYQLGIAAQRKYIETLNSSASGTNGSLNNSVERLQAENDVRNQWWTQGPHESYSMSNQRNNQDLLKKDYKSELEDAQKNEGNIRKSRHSPHSKNLSEKNLVKHEISGFTPILYDNSVTSTQDLKNSDIIQSGTQAPQFDQKATTWGESDQTKTSQKQIASTTKNTKVRPQLETEFVSSQGLNQIASPSSLSNQNPTKKSSNKSLGFHLNLPANPFSPTQLTDTKDIPKVDTTTNQKKPQIANPMQLQSRSRLSLLINGGGGSILPTEESSAIERKSKIATQEEIDMMIEQELQRKV